MSRLFKILIIYFTLIGVILSQESTIIVTEKRVKLEEMNEKGYTEAIEGLKQIEGIHFTRRGKSSIDLNLRGLSKDNINILIDGDKAYGACPNRMDPPASLITFDNLESIEVIKGPYDVKNQGSMGGAVYTKTKDIKLGLENSVKLQVGSYDEKVASFRSAYGLETFKIAVTGSYQGYKPYKDGNGNSITKVYPDLDHPLYLFPYPTSISIDGTSINLANFNYEYPGVLPFDLQNAPSSNRYKYQKRNILTEKKTAGIKTVIAISPQQELEIEGYYFTTANSLTPYLLMDMVWDEFKKGSIQYSIKNINENLKKLSFKVYGSDTLHDMTDELRCSSTTNNINCSESNLSRTYGMRSWATSSLNGFRIDAETNILQKTNFGIDTYIRKWNIETTTRMPFPSNINKQIPPMMGGMGHGMGMMPMVNYRTQGSLPDTQTNNLGFYVENEHKVFDKLKHKVGIRYDIHSTKAKKDRRIVYNIYYPGYDPFLQFKYVSYTFTEAFTIFDAEVYLPSKEPKRDLAEGSGYMKWEYEFTSDTKAKLGLAYGSRFPDPQELFFALLRMGTIAAPDFVGNPTLKATRNKQVDVGLETKQEKLKFEFDVFYSALDNYTIVRNTPDHFLGNITKDDLLYHWIVMPSMMGMPSYNFYQYINAQITYYAGILSPSMMFPYGRFGKTYKQVDAILYGGELNLKYQISEQYIAKAGLSYSRGINETEDTNLPEIPPLKGLVGIKYLIQNYYVELEGEFAATQNLVDKNIGEKRTPGWGIGNLYFGYELQKSDQQSTKITAGIKNIFNRYYYEHLSYLRDPYAIGIKIPEPGRNVFVQLTMNF
mgnify:CR=1 FL=1